MRMQHTSSGRGQLLARRIVNRTQQLMERQTAVEIDWVSGHMGVKENQRVDMVAKEAAERTVTRECPERFASLSHVSRTVMERKLKEAKCWFKAESPLQ